MFEGEVAEQYDAWYNTALGAFVDEVETACAFGLLNPTSGQRVLDVGCGTGNFTVKLARRGVIAVGIDMSEDMLDVARRKASREGFAIDFQRTDAHDLEFDDSTFDAVLSIATFEFLADPERALGEALRVVTTGGAVVVGTIHRDSPWGELYGELGRNGDPVFSHARLLSRRQLKALRQKELICVEGCLRVRPDADESTDFYRIERNDWPTPPGFVCALWRKGS